MQKNQIYERVGNGHDITITHTVEEIVCATATGVSHFSERPPRDGCVLWKIVHAIFVQSPILFIPLFCKFTMLICPSRSEMAAVRSLCDRPEHTGFIMAAKCAHNHLVGHESRGGHAAGQMEFTSNGTRLMTNLNCTLSYCVLRCARILQTYCIRAKPLIPKSALDLNSGNDLFVSPLNSTLIFICKNANKHTIRTYTRLMAFVATAIVAI